MKHTKNVIQIMLKALEWAAGSEHHPACSCKHNGVTCNCHVAAAKNAIAEAHR